LASQCGGSTWLIQISIRTWPPSRRQGWHQKSCGAFSPPAVYLYATNPRNLSGLHVPPKFLIDSSRWVASIRGFTVFRLTQRFMMLTALVTKGLTKIEPISWVPDNTTQTQSQVWSSTSGFGFIGNMILEAANSSPWYSIVWILIAPQTK